MPALSNSLLSMGGLLPWTIPLKANPELPCEGQEKLQRTMAVFKDAQAYPLSYIMPTYTFDYGWVTSHYAPYSIL